MPAEQSSRVGTSSTGTSPAGAWEHTADGAGCQRRGMTSPHPESHPPFDGSHLGGVGDLTLNRPGALIAALPALLGFVPAESLILVSLERGQIGAVLRVDL